MALFSNNDDSVQLYAKTSEELMTSNLSIKDQKRLQRHSNLHVLSFVLHLLWLVTTIAVVVTILKLPRITQDVQASASTSKLVDDGDQPATYRIVEEMMDLQREAFDMSLNVSRNQLEDAVNKLNEMLSAMKNQQEEEKKNLEKIQVQLEQQQRSLNDSLQALWQEFRTQTRSSNSSQQSFNSQLVQLQRVVNSNQTALQQQLDSHLSVAADNFNSLTNQQENISTVLRAEVHEKLDTIRMEMFDAVNETLGYLSRITDQIDTDTQFRILEVYNQEYSLSNYLYDNGLPAMSELTTCFWFKLQPNYDRTAAMLMSLSISGSDNELIIGWTPGGRLAFYIRNQVKEITISNGVDVDAAWRGWHEHCFTWKASGRIYWYTDITTAGQLEQAGSAYAYSSTIRSGGHLILLQEQDDFGGRLDLDQTLPGQLTEFNMWNYQMSLWELNRLSCGGVGNVVEWSGLKEQGTSLKTTAQFPKCQGRILPVYHQARTISNYMYQTNFPPLSEMTVCFWFNGQAGDDRNGDFLISVARTEQQNELILGWQYTGQFSIYIRNVATAMPLVSPNDDMDALWVGWHKHCITWVASTRVMWYTDTDVSGKLELVASASLSSGTVRSGGHLTLLQEQDSVGGGFDLEQTVPGQMAEFNMWDYAMALSQLNTDTCSSTGNVVSWDTLQFQGTKNITYEYFTSC
ncbi:uncharacterized protein [Watersipora subatra]|uniref:uncharacterized protein n=1 Tax=Watersipora subatra TaxID=2589382 RepID=UPI00355BECCA